MAKNYCIRCMEPLKDGENVCTSYGHEGTYEAPLHHLKPGTILQEKYLVGADISPNQEAALMRGLSIRTADRFQSADDLLAALSAVSEDEIKTVCIAHCEDSGSTSTRGQTDQEPQKEETLLIQRGETAEGRKRPIVTRTGW